MRPDQTLDRAAAKSLRQSARRHVCCFFKERCVARDDLVAQWSSLAVGDRNVSGGPGLACVIDCPDRNVLKAAGGQFFTDARDIVIAVRSPRHEPGRIMREQRGQGIRHDIGEMVVGEGRFKAQRKKGCRRSD